MTMKLLPLVLIVLLCGIGAARLPAVGDHVIIELDDHTAVKGNITDVDNYFIVLNVTQAFDVSGKEHVLDARPQNKTFSLGIGKQTIDKFVWT